MADRISGFFRVRGIVAAFALLSALVPPTLAMALPAGVDTLEALDHQYQEYFTKGEYAKAIEVAQSINNSIEERHCETLFNIGLCNFRLGQKVKAYEWFQRAVDAGFWDTRRFTANEEFAAVKGEERFKEIARGAWANGYIYLLERPERDEFQKPAEVLKSLALKPGLRVADIGCGTGYFTVPVARAIGAEGSVLAIDISPQMLAYLEKRIKAEQLTNVVLKKVKSDDPELPTGGIDLILMVDTIHYVKEKAAYAEKLRAGLAPGGRLIVIDYIPKPMSERPWGPTPEQQISRADLGVELAKAGFREVQSFDYLPEQYFVVYQLK
jgi:ubiquinone/menaquinone biosynthesis C-methylase UbiE